MHTDALTIKSFLFRELICSLILGGVPCTLIVLNGGVDAVLGFMEGLSPHSSILKFFLCLLAIHGVVWLFSDFWFKSSDTIDAALGKLHQISDQVGFSLLGVYRAISGALFVAMPDIVFSAPTLANGVVFALGYFFASGCIFMCCLLSYIQAKTTARVHYLQGQF